METRDMIQLGALSGVIAFGLIGAVIGFKDATIGTTALGILATILTGATLSKATGGVA